MRVIAILALAALAWAGQAAAQSRRDSPRVARPTPGEAKPIAYGRWVVDREGDWVEAWTDNPSGSEFGLICSSDCMIYLDFKITCEDGADYPAMVNSGAGAIPITMRCYHYGKRPIFITEATGEYIAMLEHGGEIGFAFPLENGLFRVARFPTQGGYQAMIAAVRIAIRSGKLKQAPKDVDI